MESVGDRFTWLFCACVFSQHLHHSGCQPFAGIDEASESEEESEEEKQNEEEAKEDEEEEEGKKTPVQFEKKKKKGELHIRARCCRLSRSKRLASRSLSCVAFVAADSSGESESSDDSDIEKETASALFMVITVSLHQSHFAAQFASCMSSFFFFF